TRSGRGERCSAGDGRRHRDAESDDQRAPMRPTHARHAARYRLWLVDSAPTRRIRVRVEATVVVAVELDLEPRHATAVAFVLEAPAVREIRQEEEPVRPELLRRLRERRGRTFAVVVHLDTHP